MVDASVLLARSLHSLASGAGAAPLTVDRKYATALVANLSSCLILESPGLSCYLAAQLITPSESCTRSCHTVHVHEYTVHVCGTVRCHDDDGC